MSFNKPDPLSEQVLPDYDFVGAPAAPGSPVGYPSATTIAIDPHGIADHADEMARRIDSIQTHIVKVDDAFQIPDVGWAGSSKEEATAFSEKWLAAIVGLFGNLSTDQTRNVTNPKPDGAANKLLYGVQLACNNFASAEDGVKAGWDHYTAALTVPPGPWDGGARSSDDGPIMEHNPKK